MNLNLETKQHLHFGHLGLILSAAVILVGLSWMKQPSLFNVFKAGSSGSNVSANLPHYYAYQPPAELNLPSVAGASTQNQGPMVINEDGTLSPGVEIGDILGANTETVVLDTKSVQVKQIEDSEQNFKNYISSMQNIEGGYLDSVMFEAALSSGNQNQINDQAKAIEAIVKGLSGLSVPASLSELHKLKILQYQAGLQILQNFTNADENPELINHNLDVFLKTEQQIQTEIEGLKDKLNLSIGE